MTLTLSQQKKKEKATKYAKKLNPIAEKSSL